MASTKEFFAKKKNWSKYKDDLLGSYILPYFTKIMSTGIPIVYIDGFAGKGKFDDGSAGSPLLVKEKIYQAKSISSFKNTPIDAYFVEYGHADCLRANLSDSTMKVIQGDYRIEVPKILRNNYRKNIFLYVDPFGVKYLDFGIFSGLDPSKYKSVELLLNFNSFGFLREGCRLLKIEMEKVDEEIPDFSIEGNDFKNDIANMNRIANGDYCTEKDPTREELRDEVDGILAKFPRLKLILAHMYFMTGELERAADFLDRHESVYYDLTPGKDIFPDFTSKHEEWRKFVIKYQRRILYGTDTYSTPLSGKSEEEVYGGPINLVRTFLEKENILYKKVLSKFEINSFDLVMFRPDPPVDIDYINATYESDSYVVAGKAIALNAEVVKQDGTKGFSVDIVADEVEFLSSKNDGSSEGGLSVGGTDAVSELQPINDDNLPF